MKGLVLLLALVWASPTLAHTRSEAHSVWSFQEGHLSGTVTVLAREATRLPEGSAITPDQFAAYLQGTITAEPCAEARARALPSNAGHLRVELGFACPKEGPITLTIASFFEYMSSHAHYARIRMEGSFDEHVVTLARQVIVLGAEGAAEPVSAVTRLTDFLTIGIEHIVSGLDHLAFLLAVILLAGTGRQIALAITGFTVGHSITLALATLDWVTPHPGLVEAAIGFTIALVAVEVIAERTGIEFRAALGFGASLFALAGLSLLSPQPLADPLFLAGFGLFSVCYFVLVGRLEGSARLPWLRTGVTALFGLIHGFGFAGNLTGLGFSPDNILPMLIGFNLGVEIGQIALVLAALALAYAARRLVPAFRKPEAVEALAALLIALGVFWFLDRAYGVL